jgi:ABC-type branched-subunit amino acid transport system ATPase component
MISPLLTIEHLFAGYGRQEILHDVSLSVFPGEFVALIGPNGAGKSTVLKSVFGLADIASGRVVFLGEETRGLPRHVLLGRGISYVPQGHVVFPSLSVRENLAIGAYLLKEKALVLKRLEDVYDQFSVLREKRNERAGHLSGGEQQQLAIGRALMMTPKILLLDEPSLGLSPKLQEEVFQKFKKLQGAGLTILCVEQNVTLALRFADRGVLLVAGRVRLEGDAEKLLGKDVMARAYL